METLTLESKIDNNKSISFYNPKTDKIETKKWTELEGKRLVVMFYPADFTFVCPTELKDLNNAYSDLQNSNANVFVASTDTVFSHKRWIETESLLKGFEIPMISDRTGEISKYFGSFNEQSGNAARGTFIISPDGIVKSIEITTEPLGRSAAELVRKVKALEYIRNNPGHACPASRNIGQQDLTPGLDLAGKVGELLK
ncbi:MAG: redoxin domain-containing protein [Candidatus Absconditabacteria bacterium]